MSGRIAALGLLVAGILAVSSLSAGSRGDARRGAQGYRACVACHALEPGLHLSGPSLANVLGRKAGSVEGYRRYSPGLREASFEWNAATLDAWLSDPASMVPGNYMVFRGIEDQQVRADLVAFLQVAGGPNGGRKVVVNGLIPGSWVSAGAPAPLRNPLPTARVAAIRHCGDSYFITTEDGRERPYWEKNIRLKIDGEETGPPPGVPVILGAGMRGDRFSVVFSSLADLKAVVEEKC
jgi:cytochrome c